MSECLHIHDENGHHTGYVCRGGPFKYQPATHAFGAHKWKPVGEPLATISEAFQVLGKTLEDNRRRYPRLNRAGIWAVEEMSYYEPHQVYEVTVR